jgi:hypothetical protein
VAQRRHQARRVHGLIGEHVAPIALVDAGMNVHAAAGEVGKGLGHERGAEAVTARHALDDAPQQQRMVAGATAHRAGGAC